MERDFNRVPGDQHGDEFLVIACLPKMSFDRGCIQHGNYVSLDTQDSFVLLKSVL